MHREETATDSTLLSEAKALYRSGNCEEAASLFRQCRGNDHAEALCFIATMILDKVINPRTSEDPEKLLQKSADMGFPPAKYRLESLKETQDSIDDAMTLDSQHLTPPKEYTEEDFLKGGNVDLGIERRKESVLYYANQGYVNAMYEYGMMNLDEESRDLKVGAFWLGRAAQKGHAMAQYELGCLYFRGEGVPKDDLMALLWLGRAREQGIYRAHCELAKIYTDRKNKFYSPEEGVRLLNQVKELCPEAYMMLAQIYLRDDIVQYDAEKAREYLEKAKAEGVLGAYVEIAKLYILERRYSDALPLLKHVADKQDSESLYLLALIFERFGENKALDKVIDNRRNSADEHDENVESDASEPSGT
jgi:TPR repeat protein